LVVVVE